MDRIKIYLEKINRWHTVLFLFLLVELRLLPGGQIGFTCNDPALSHTFNGDTISWKWLMAITVFLPLLVMTVIEKKYHNDNPKRPRNRILRWYIEYLYGLAVNLTLVQTLKLVVGSPRPHFFDTCSPEEAKTCTGSEYISQYTCTKAHWLAQSNKSFPSGHTSLAVHAGVFVAYYLSRRLKEPASSISRYLQAVSVLSVVVCSISRMTDHRHHWWDVLSGAAIAAPILVYTILILCKNFEVRYSSATASPVKNESNPSNLSNNENNVNS